ncbi:MAG TPA: type I restriction endonuclease subunit M [Planctomycetaceae bacterium]|nr:type I restriction endonuclease subunit M [Planctomycetaceae bacterium]
MEDVNQIALFPMGRIVMTKGIHLAIAADEMLTALLRHANGDWGDVCDEDRRSNEEALERHFRLFSVYHASDKTKFWIITEADRSCTTILLPEEY